MVFYKTINHQFITYLISLKSYKESHPYLTYRLKNVLLWTINRRTEIFVCVVCVNVYIVLPHCAVFIFFIDFHYDQCNLKEVCYKLLSFWESLNHSLNRLVQKMSNHSGTKQATLVQKLLKTISTTYDNNDLKSHNYEINKKLWDTK